MPIDQFQRALTAQLEQAIRNHVDAIGEGKAQTIDDYRYRVGVIRGYRDALEMASDVAKKLYGDGE